MSDSTRTWIAEVMGTFALVFIGGLSILAGQGDLTVLSLGFGLALLVGLYAFGEVSGGHFNPAVSLGALLDKRIDTNTFIQYVISQAGGASIAMVAILGASSQDAVAGTVTRPGAASVGGAFMLEILLTGLFVGVILKVTASEANRNTAFLGISLTLVAIHLAAAPLTGASVNPARSLGSALVGGDFGDFWIYVTAPFIGAALGWIVYKAITVEIGERELT
jgi:aquaporin Z